MNDFRPAIPIVLSIAGSDNTGGAGIQADIKTCVSCGVYPATVITAITAQNSSGLKAIKYVGSEMLKSQLEATLEFARPDAVKIGLIPNTEAATIVREILRRHNIRNIVIDPVLSATTGGSFGMDSDHEIDEVCSLLLDAATLVTPNIPELYRIAGEDNRLCNTEKAALKLIEKYSVNAVLIKGGHSELTECTDLLIGKDFPAMSFSYPRIESPHTHGTGCTLSSAIASALAKGCGLQESVRFGKDTVTRAIIRGRDCPVTEKYGPVQP